MEHKYITVADIVRSGNVSKAAVYKQIRAGKLTFKDGKADPVKLLAEWRKKRDPSRDDKIGPALEQIIAAAGLPQPAQSTESSKPATTETVMDTNGAPLHLSAEMRRFWKSVTDEYELEDDALLILRTACEAFDRAQTARELIAREGMIVNNRRHPAVDIEAQSQSLFLRAMRALGLDVVPPGPIGRPAGR